LRASYSKTGFNVESVERAAADRKSQFSIHSQEAILFHEKVLNAGSRVLNTLREGLVLDFVSQPGRYFEDNNNSAKKHMDIVREKVQEWVTDSYVECLDNAEFCCSPLSVVVKYDALTEKTKFRVVLDLSRHVNQHIKNNSVKLDDLSVAEAVLEQGDFLTAYDLKNMFFHVRLHESMKKYFGFAVPDKQGIVKYYRFNVLVYGCKPAVSIVTELLKPVKTYLHRLGVRTTIYVDDGRVAGETKAEASAKMSLCLTVLQLAGWNIQWEKTELNPEQELYYLGFVTDTVKMCYYTPPKKLELIHAAIAQTLDAAKQNRPISARDLATVVGKIAALRRSHGSIVHVMSRSTQHDLGVHTLWQGWDGFLWLSVAAVSELRFLLDILHDCNGQYIFSAATLSHVVQLSDMRERVAHISATAENLDNLYVSDASESHAFIYKADGSFDYVREFEFDEEQAKGGSGHRELLAIKLSLTLDEHEFSKNVATKIYWQTDSKNCFNFLTRGSRRSAIQKDVLAIKKLEKKLNVLIIPVWSPREHFRIVMADIGSKFSHSTDEWSVNREQLLSLFTSLSFWPTIDAFATAHNHVCDLYFSLLPQTGTAGLNFFAQVLQPSHRYFCCPPIKLLVPCFRALIATPGVQALLLMPEWHSASYWPYFFTGTKPRKYVVSVTPFEARFFYTNQASSNVFTSRPKFRMLALHIHVPA
jgi:hypothetical protein